MRETLKLRHRASCLSVFVGFVALGWLVMTSALSGCGKIGDPTRASSAPAPIILFSGHGTSPNDVAAVEAVLRSRHYEYLKVDSAHLDQMTAKELGGHQLLIVPGGNFVEMGERLNSKTMIAIREAVQDGLNYLGICGGAFLASDSGYNSINLTSGVRFKFYAAEEQGIRKTVVPITTPTGPTLDQYWEDGPQLTGWGSVVGKYPDGFPAIVQGNAGRGCVILSGIHPEAPENWRGGMTFRTSAREDAAFAASLIEAALTRTQLDHF